jgi:tripartite-type tricarboxylate transporter receptor subunit TctC
MTWLTRILLACALGAGGLVAWPALGQPAALPKTIRLVVPFPPGNAADIQARALAEQLRRAHGLSMVVDNRPGASGAIALQHVAAARPDGATLAISSLSPLVVTPATNRSLPYDTERDFAPVALLGFNDVVLVAGPEISVTTLPELLALARRRPDDLTYASIGNGTLAHMVMEVIATRSNVRLRHVPYKGSSPAYADLLGGQVSMMADGMPQALAQIKAGKFKPLAVLSKARSPFLGHVPTVAELNLPGLQGFEVLGWTGLVAPAGTPREVVAALNAEVVRIFGSPEVRDLLAAQSLQSFPAHAPDAFGAYIRTELANWRAMARAAGVEGAQ